MRGKDAVVDGKGDPGAYNPMEGRDHRARRGALAQQVGADRVGRVWLEGERGTQMVSSDTPGAGSVRPEGARLRRPEAGLGVRVEDEARLDWR